MMNIRDQVRVQAITNIENLAKEVIGCKVATTKIQGGRHCVAEKLMERGKKRRQTRAGVVRSLYHQQGVTKGSLQSQKKKDGTELKTSFDSSRLKIYYHSVQSHPNTNT